MHKGLSYAAGGGKAIVLGMLERGGKVRAGVIVDRKLATMRKPVLETLAADASMMTDEHAAYPFIAKEQTLRMSSSTTSKVMFVSTSTRTASKTFVLA